jgi:hypothetical protein
MIRLDTVDGIGPGLNQPRAMAMPAIAADQFGLCASSAELASGSGRTGLAIRNAVFAVGVGLVREASCRRPMRPRFLSRCPSTEGLGSVSGLNLHSRWRMLAAWL